MELVSAILWVLIGILYIIYKAFKEKPGEATNITIVCVSVVGGFIGFVYLLRFLLGRSVLIGIVFAVICVGLLCTTVAASQIKEHKKNKELKSSKKAEIEQIRSTLSDKDLEECAFNNRYSLHISMDSRHWNYWKKEPYYSRVVQLAEIIRYVNVKKSTEKLEVTVTHTHNNLYAEQGW